MATYFKYAEREADSQINWAEVGKNMSDMLLEERRLREEKKAQIDAESREFGETLSNPPQGESKALNEYALQYAADYQQSRLMQDKLLKSGQLKLSDYTVMRQNGIDGTKQMFEVVNGYNTEYKEKMDRMKNNQSQDLEGYLMEQIEGLSNFMNTKAYINPTDGKVSVAKMVKGEDGVMKMSTDPNDFSTISSLQNRLKAKYDRFDVSGTVGTYVDGLGEKMKTITDIKNKYQRGTVTEIFDATQIDNFSESDKAIVKTFEDAETKMLESMLGNVFHTSSILTNSLNVDPKTGKEYTFTWSEEDAKANPNLILLKNDSSGNPQPQFTEEQKSNALEYLRVQARLMYDKKTQVSVVGASEPQKKTQTEIDAENAKKTKQSLLQSWQLIRNGTDEQKKAALDAIKGSPNMIARGLTNIYIQDDKVYFEYADPRLNTPVDISDNADAFFRAGAEVFGDTTEEELAKYATGNKVAPTTELRSSRGAVDYTQRVQQHVATDAGIVTSKPDETVDYLTKKFGGLGFSFSGFTDNGVYDYITITPPAGSKEDAKTFSIDDSSQLGDIRKFLNNNFSAEGAEEMFGNESKSSSSSSGNKSKSKVNYATK